MVIQVIPRRIPDNILNYLETLLKLHLNPPETLVVRPLESPLSAFHISTAIPGEQLYF